MKRKHLPELNDSQLIELSGFYWETDISTQELQSHYNLTKPVQGFVVPFKTKIICPNCGDLLVFVSRAARNRNERICILCKHNDRSIYMCGCDYCKNLLQQEKEIQKEKHRIFLENEYKNLTERTANPEWVSWALNKLTRREKMFIKAFLEVVKTQMHPTWEEICRKAEVVSEKSYLKKLLELNLLYKTPQGNITRNPALNEIEIELETVRKIKPSLRFEIFQRDEHTCQYCGRSAPEVILHLDHLLPVAKGGNDDPENLITSCAECNSGKSDKLIRERTNGFTKAEWQDVIREKKTKFTRRTTGKNC